MHAVSNALFSEFISKEIVSIHIKLQTKRCPGGNTQITQAQFFIKEIKIIMETFALVKFQESLTSRLIMPGLIGITLFHSRENMNQPFCFSGHPDDFLDAVIFPESAKFPDEFNFNPILICDALSVLTD